jgi:hypothetical protein
MDPLTAREALGPAAIHAELLLPLERLAQGDNRVTTKTGGFILAQDNELFVDLSIAPREWPYPRWHFRRGSADTLTVLSHRRLDQGHCVALFRRLNPSTSRQSKNGR